MTPHSQVSRRKSPVADRISGRSRRRRPASRFGWASLEILEVRALFSGFSTVDVSSTSPVDLHIEKTKAGQTIPLTVQFSTSDTTTPEDIENEWVEIRGSDGYQVTVYDYGTQTVQFPISQNGETISAYIDGDDDDENASITAGDRQLQVSVDLTALAAPFRTFADDLQKSEDAIERILEYTPGWQFFPPKLSPPEIGGKVVGQVSIGPDGSIDQGSIALQGTFSDDLTAELYWGLPAKLAGLSVSLTAGLGVSLTGKAEYDHGVVNVSGEAKGEGSLTLAGNAYLTFFKANVYGKAAIELPVESVEGGVAKGPVNLVGEAGGSILYKGLTDDKYSTLANFSTPFGPLKLTDWEFDYQSVFDAAVQIAEDSVLGDPLLVTTQPTTAASGAPFGLTFTATNADGTTNTAFNGPVTLIDPGKSDLSGHTTINAVHGVATFAGLSLSGTGSHQLYASSAVGSVYTAPIRLAGATVGAPAPSAQAAAPATPAVSKFAFAGRIGTTPPNWVGGDPVVTPGAALGVTVYAEDANGVILSSYNGPVTLTFASNPTGAKLNGTVTVNAVNGVATFSGLSVDKAGVGFVLTTTGTTASPGASNTFDVADYLAITTPSPRTLVAGTSFGLVVQAQDASGKLDASFNGDVTISDSNYSGGPTNLIHGAVTVKAVKGVATFSGLTLDEAGYYSLLINGSGVTFTSQLFQVTPAAASQVVVKSGPPSTQTVGSPISVTVEAEDPFGNVVSTASGTATLAIATGPAGATLGGTTTAGLSGGLATFSGLTLNKAGSGYALKATATGLSAATTSAFAVTPAGVATHLFVTAQAPSSLTAGAPFGLVVKAEDDAGAVDANYQGTVTLSLSTNLTGGTLGGTVTLAASHGVATFSGLSISTKGSYAIQASSTGLTSATSSGLFVAPGVASQLVITSPAGSLVTGTSFSTTVTLEDAFGNVASDTQSVTLALGANPGGATLGGSLTTTAFAGVAQFTSLTIDKSGGGYTLKATSGKLPAATTTAFDVEDAKLVVATSPAPTAAGSAFGLVVKALGSSGAVDTTFKGAVSLGLLRYNGNAATLAGTLVVNAINGVATFSGLSLDQVGTYALTITAGGATPVTTTVFRITAANLAVGTPPPSALNATAPFPLTILVGDSSGNIDPTFEGPVTIVLKNNPGGATLGGTVTVNAVDGVATFAGLTLDKPGAGYTLMATSAGLSSTTTGAVNVVAAGTATRLVVVAAAPESAVAGSPFGLTIRAEDTLGNLITGFHGSVTISDALGELKGKVTVNAVNGVATFSGLAIDQAEPFDVLQATSPGLVSASAGSVQITPAPATQLAISLPADRILAGAPFAIEALAVDAFGNLDSTYNGMVTLSLGANAVGASLGGTLTVRAVHGTATFTGVAINKAANGLVLSATGAVGIAGVGPRFDVTNDRLVFAAQPTGSVAAGSPFSLTVAAEDASGAVDAGFHGDVTISAPTLGQYLAGAATARAVNGVATFTGLSLNQAVPYLGTLDAHSGNVPAGTSASIFVAPGTAAQLALTVAPPTAVTLGAGFAIDVAVEDVGGNVETSYNGPVTLNLTGAPAGTTLGGTLTVNAVGGVAAFAGLTLGGATGTDVLTAAAAGLSPIDTAAIHVQALGVATHLVVTAQPPSSVAAGTGFGLAVAAEDGFGTVDTSFHGPVTLTDAAGIPLGGGISATATAGVATFAGITIDQSGSGIVLSATGVGLGAANSSAISVTPLAATHLDVQLPGGDPAVGSTFGVVASAEDAFGNVDPTFQGPVTLALATDPSGATLGGTLNAIATGGTAFFPGLSLDKAGTGYTLASTTTGLASATSAPFSATSGSLVVTSQPTAPVIAGITFDLTVGALDTAGLADAGFGGPITALLVDPDGTGATLGGPVTVDAKSGVATFTGLTVDRAGRYLVSFSGAGLAPGNSAILTILPNPALATTTAVASDHPAGSIYGQAVTFTATVGASAGTPTGTVQFVVDGQAVGAPVALVNGAASISLAMLHAASHQVEAIYASDAPTGFLGSRTAIATPLQVNPAPLTITAADASILFGATPTLAAHYAGFVNGDTAASLSSPPVLATDATAGSPAGTYAITVGGATDPDYAITYVAGTLTIVPTVIVPPTSTTITGRVYLDLNADGSPQVGEPGLGGRVVYLDLNHSGSLDTGEPTAITDADGVFTLTTSGPAGPVAEATDQDATYRNVVDTVVTNADGTVSIGVVPIAAIAPIPVIPGSPPIVPTSDPNVAYVRSLYRSVLGRNGGDVEVAGWVALMGQGANRLQVSLGILNSLEHRIAEVDAYYGTLLHRSLDAFAMGWVEDLMTGTSEEAVVQGILGSPEYQSAHQDPTLFIRDLYIDVLGRLGDPTGLSSWQSALQSGVARETIIADFVTSPEAGDQLVSSFYSAFLHRPREQGTTSNGWTDILKSAEGSANDVAAGILSSPEYAEESSNPKA